MNDADIEKAVAGGGEDGRAIGRRGEDPVRSRVLLHNKNA
jgi:hypothetical protein